MWTAENRARYNRDVRNPGVMYGAEHGMSVAIGSHQHIRTSPGIICKTREYRVQYPALQAIRRDPSRPLRHRSRRPTSACTAAAEEALLQREQTCRSPACKVPQKTGY
jgi:hypothetical protein